MPTEPGDAGVFPSAEKKTATAKIPSGKCTGGCSVAVVVQKFGGSSVKDAERVTEAARKAIRAKRAGNHVIVVVSAQGSTTDDLIAKAAEITDEPNAREMDMLLATGEQISIALTAMAIHELGERAVSLTGPQLGIVTDSTHRK